MKFRDYLEAEGACREAREWVGDKSIQQAWEECEYLDWMIWLISHLGRRGEARAMLTDAAYSTVLGQLDAGVPEQAKLREFVTARRDGQMNVSARSTFFWDLVRDAGVSGWLGDAIAYLPWGDQLGNLRVVFNCLGLSKFQLHSDSQGLDEAQRAAVCREGFAKGVNDELFKKVWIAAGIDEYGGGGPAVEEEPIMSPNRGSEEFNFQVLLGHLGACTRARRACSDGSADYVWANTNNGEDFGWLIDNLVQDNCKQDETALTKKDAAHFRIASGLLRAVADRAKSDGRAAADAIMRLSEAFAAGSEMRARDLYYSLKRREDWVAIEYYSPAQELEWAAHVIIEAYAGLNTYTTVWTNIYGYMFRAGLYRDSVQLMRDGAGLDDMLALMRAVWDGNELQANDSELAYYEPEDEEEEDCDCDDEDCDCDDEDEDEEEDDDDTDEPAAEEEQVPAADPGGDVVGEPGAEAAGGEGPVA